MLFENACGGRTNGSLETQRKPRILIQPMLSAAVHRGMPCLKLLATQKRLQMSLAAITYPTYNLFRGSYQVCYMAITFV